MSFRSNTPEKLKFLMVSILIMVAVNFTMAGLESKSQTPSRVSRTSAVNASPAAHPASVLAESDVPHQSPVPRVVVVRNVKTIEMAASAGPVMVSLPPERPVSLRAFSPVLPDYKAPHKGPLARIALIIDDMGLTPDRDKAVVAFPAAVTLAYLPYATDVAVQARQAREQGHELLIHTPMEPMNGHLDMGPIALRAGMDEAEFKAVLREKVFPAFTGYVGINNHMGSRLTQDPVAMKWVMEELKSRGLAFVDSMTISTSIAARTAREAGLPVAERDVFLDHIEEESAVMKQLAVLEKEARANGYAVAIGHPKPHTIRALQAWIPGLKARGFELVPVSEVLEKPADTSTKTASTR